MPHISDSAVWLVPKRNDPSTRLLTGQPQPATSIMATGTSTRPESSIAADSHQTVLPWPRGVLSPLPSDYARLAAESEIDHLPGTEEWRRSISPSISRAIAHRFHGIASQPMLPPTSSTSSQSMTPPTAPTTLYNAAGTKTRRTLDAPTMANTGPPSDTEMPSPSRTLAASLCCLAPPQCQHTSVPS